MKINLLLLLLLLLLLFWWWLWLFLKFGVAALQSLILDSERRDSGHFRHLVRVLNFPISCGIPTFDLMFVLLMVLLFLWWVWFMRFGSFPSSYSFEMAEYFADIES